MSEAIIVSIISLVGTLGGSLGGILVSNKLTNYRIEQLEKKVEKHNNLVERMYICEGQLKVLEEKAKDFEGDLSDLKRANA